MLPVEPVPLASPADSEARGAWWICDSFESIFQLFVVGQSVSGDSARLFLFFLSWEQIAHQVVSEGCEQNALLRWKAIFCVRFWTEGMISSFALA